MKTPSRDWALVLTRIEIDHQAEQLLEDAEYALDTVLADGEVFSCVRLETYRWHGHRYDR